METLHGDADTRRYSLLQGPDTLQGERNSVAGVKNEHRRMSSFRLKYFASSALCPW